MSPEHHKTIQKYYSKRADDYDHQKRRTWSSPQGFSLKIINTTIQFLSNLEGGIVLEVAIGSARMALPIMESIRAKIVGLDLSPEMLQLTQKRLAKYTDRWALTIGAGEQLPFQDNTVDALVCISAFHYFPEPKATLAEFRRVLKDGGTFVYGDLTLHDSDEGGFLDKLESTISHAHAKYYRPLELRSLFKECGFRINEIETTKYQKSYSALIQDKAQYFGVNPDDLDQIITKATEHERDIYGIKAEMMTLFYTMIKNQKETGGHQ